MQRDVVAQAARGRWYGILSQLGVDEQFLNGKHGPCPMCGGKDRFRFDDRDGDGTYFCNACRPSDGFGFLMKFRGWDFPTALKRVAEITGGVEEGPHPKINDPRKALRSVLAGCTNHRKPVLDYLHERGLSVVPRCLRYHPGLDYFELGGAPAIKVPAMLAIITGADGSPQSIHRTFLGNVSQRKKVMSPVNTIRGGAIRLFEPSEVLGIAEGIETAIAAYELSGIPTWAAVSATVMQSFSPPGGVRQLMIFADNDAAFAGQKAAYSAAHRAACNGIEVTIHIPPQQGTDWLDVLREKATNNDLKQTGHPTPPLAGATKSVGAPGS